MGREVDDMKKWLPVIGYTVLAVVVYYMIDVLLSMVFGLWILSVSSKEQYYRYTLFANMIQKAVTLLVFGFWYRKKTAKSRPAKRLRGKISVKNGICLLGIGLFGQYAMSFLLMLIYLAFPAAFARYEELTSSVSLSNSYPLLILFLVVILGPVAEEIFFRGVIYGQLREGFSAVAAACISGVMFGVYHKNLVQGIYATICGVVLAYLFEKTHTIWGSIITHVMFNLSSYLVAAVRNILNHFHWRLPAVYLFAIQLLCLVIVCLLIHALRRETEENELSGCENELF